MIKASFLDERKLPLLLEPENAAQSNLLFLIDSCRTRRKFFQEKLLAHGALLFRGFSISSAADFETFARSFSGKDLWNYVGGASPRFEISGGVYTSTEYPPHLTLALHNELSYSEKYPQHLFFCCLTPAEQGGETTLGDSRKILQSIKPEIVTEFKNKGVMYVRNLQSGAGSGYSWQDAFETEDKSIVEGYCRRVSADFQWKPDGGLRLSQIRPSTAIHPITGEEVWFNQAIGFHPSELDDETYRELISLMPENEFRLNAYFGDGSPLPVDALNHIREVLRQETVLVRWQKGDVLVLDNILTSHGRMSFTGSRKILVTMT